MQRIVLAHSGSDDDSETISRLADEYGSEIVTLTLDVGQNQVLEGADLGLKLPDLPVHTVRVPREHEPALDRLLGTDAHERGGGTTGGSPGPGRADRGFTIERR